MDNRTCLFVIDMNTDDALVAQHAEAAAEQGTHLACVLLGPAPTLPYASYGVPPYGAINIPDNWVELVQTAQVDTKARADEVEQILARSGASGSVDPVTCAIVDIRHAISKRALCCDVVRIADGIDRKSDIFREAAHGALFQSPAGLVLNARPLGDAKRILVAWDSSLPAARAAHVALPYLIRADEVTIACFDPAMTADRDGEDPGADIAAWLSHHGCRVTVKQAPSGGREIGRCIQDSAQEHGADLIVMGAYGQSRMREALFGGTTRTMLEQTELRVLFAH